MSKLEDSILEGWMHSMRQCAGLPAEPRVHESGTPHVLFVNRAVNSGRSVLSMGQVRASAHRAESSCSCTHTHARQATRLLVSREVHSGL